MPKSTGVSNIITLDVNRKIQPIAFNNTTLKEAILKVILPAYFENNGNELSIIAIDNQDKIIEFKTSETQVSQTTIMDFVKCLRLSKAESCKTTINEETIVFYSGYSDKNWLIIIGDNVAFIEASIEKLWDAIFEYK